MLKVIVLAFKDADGNIKVFKFMMSVPNEGTQGLGIDVISSVDDIGINIAEADGLEYLGHRLENLA